VLLEKWLDHNRLKRGVGEQIPRKDIIERHVVGDLLLLSVGKNTTMGAAK
jgi:hypothetical protein